METGENKIEETNIDETKKPDRKLVALLIFCYLITILMVLDLFGVWNFFDFDGTGLSTKLIGQSETKSLVSDSMMDTMKTKGCVADGILTGFGGDFSEIVSMLGRSNCQFLHRSIETWNQPPNFDLILERMNAIRNRTGKTFIYSLFVAESINYKSEYYFPDENRNFDFEKMCKDGTKGVWGENTCRPYFGSDEYLKYIKYITHRAIDLGVKDIIFGQIYYQDPNWKSEPLAGKVVDEIRAYARAKNKDVAIGAQTNTIDDEQYLRQFDYITGGVGQRESDGYIEEGSACWSYFLEKYNYCWALMWNQKYKSKANNVLVYLDWNNEANDDMNRFVRMNDEERRNFLGKAYDFFLWRGVGFLLPLQAVLDGSGNGCYGSDKIFYSASKKYSCGDEEAIREIISRTGHLPEYSQFVSQDVPTKMKVGEKYQVKVTMRNNSLYVWRKSANYELLAENPHANKVWSIEKVELENNDKIKQKETKDFIFEITAPNTPGQYNFQWRMAKDGIGFGDFSENVLIEVGQK